MEEGEEEEVMSEASGPVSKSPQSEDDIHPDFRLWVTARSDEGRLIPGE